MTFEDAPTYEEKAALAPITVRRTPLPVQTMFFPGGPEAATRVIDWVLLNNGTATWSEGQPEIFDEDTKTVIVPSEPERIYLRVTGGMQKVFPGNWVMQNTDGSFYATSALLFPENYLHN